MKCLQRLNNRGFSLIELLIVMAVMSILLAIAVPSYKRHLIKADEAVLQEDLFQMRKAIDAFYADKNAYPEALEDLVTEHYLRTIPTDPFTQSNTTWETVAPEPTTEGELAEGYVFDVHSGSHKVGLNGTPYNEW